MQPFVSPCVCFLVAIKLFISFRHVVCILKCKNTPTFQCFLLNNVFFPRKKHRNGVIAEPHSNIVYLEV